MGDEGRRPRLEFQAKATSQHLVRSDHISFPLPIKNYNDLRADVVIPRLLIVVIIPDNEAEWLIHSEKELRMRRCGYWVSLFASPCVTNQTSVTIQIPRVQLFDGNQLRQLMDKMQRGVPL
jgi:hypothetical protein